MSPGTGRFSLDGLSADPQIQATGEGRPKMSFQRVASLGKKKAFPDSSCDIFRKIDSRSVGVAASSMLTLRSVFRPLWKTAFLKEFWRPRIGLITHSYHTHSIPVIVGYIWVKKMKLPMFPYMSLPYNLHYIPYDPILSLKKPRPQNVSQWQESNSASSGGYDPIEECWELVPPLIGKEVVLSCLILHSPSRSKSEVSVIWARSLVWLVNVFWHIEMTHNILHSVHKDIIHTL